MVSAPWRQRFFQLRQRVHFDLDLDHMAQAGAQPLQRRRDAAGGGDMVVLDQAASSRPKR